MSSVISIASQIVPRRDGNIFWVTRRTLKSAPEGDFYKSICLTLLRNIIEDDNTPIKKTTGEIVARTKQEKIEAIQSQSVSIKALLEKQFGISFFKKNVITYDEWIKFIIRQRGVRSSEDEGKYEKMHDKNLRHGDLGYKTLFVVDEAHNLQSKTLSVDERKKLDEFYEDPVTVSGKTFYDRGDIYGKHIANGKIQGRDLIAAMLYQSYKLSKKKQRENLVVVCYPR